MTTNHQSAGLEPGARGTLRATGAWTAEHLAPVERELDRLRDVEAVEAAAVTALDTAGAWLLHGLRERGMRVSGLNEEREALLRLVGENATALPPPRRGPGPLVFAGTAAVAGAHGGARMLTLVGETVLGVLGTLAGRRRLRWRALLDDMQHAGVRALLIVGLLSFLMGVVIAYQGAVQLKLYGANIYIVDLVGLSLARELAPLMAAIIVAGRTGSAYTAQIGTMVVTQEVDALRTIGIPPLDLLVLPRVLSLVIVLPLLTVFADVTGLIGGMVMAKLQLGLGMHAFIDRLLEALSVRHYLLGIGKAPVFAALIALVGCYQGFMVRGGAESVGRHTTLAVVQAIFLVIVADAFFSVIFSWLGI